MVNPQRNLYDIDMGYSNLSAYQFHLPPEGYIPNDGQPDDHVLVGVSQLVSWVSAPPGTLT